MRKSLSFSLFIYLFLSSFFFGLPMQNLYLQPTCNGSTANKIVEMICSEALHFIYARLNWKKCSDNIQVPIFELSPLADALWENKYVFHKICFDKASTMGIAVVDPRFELPIEITHPFVSNTALATVSRNHEKISNKSGKYDKTSFCMLSTAIFLKLVSFVWKWFVCDYVGLTDPLSLFSDVCLLPFLVYSSLKRKELLCLLSPQLAD